MTVPLLEADATITLEGVVIGVDDGTVKLGFDTLTGWYDGPGSRSAFAPRPSDHGGFDGPVFRDPRVITVHGWALGPSRASVVVHMHKLLAVLADGQLGEIRVDDPDFGNLTAQCRLTDGPLVSPPNGGHFTWQFSVTAPDPRLYGDPVTASTGLPSSGGGLLFPVFDGTGFAEFGEPGASGQVTLSNVGTAEAWPVFTITGPVIGGVVLTDVDSGNRIVYSGNVPGGATLLIIDSAFGRATLNAADRTGELTVKQWFSVPPGGSVTVQFATLGTSGQAGQLNPASLTPAYW